MQPHSVDKMNRCIIAIFVLVLLHFAQAEPPTCSPQFKCFDDEVYKYEILGTNFTCDVGQICNNDHTSTDCTPCVNLGPSICKYTCVNDTSGTFHVRADQPFQCGKNEVCNAAYMQTCTPCIPLVCEENYKCSKTNPREIIIKEEVLLCPEGNVCNNAFTAPCDMCISDTSTPSVRSTVKTSIATPSTPAKPPARYPPNCNDGFSPQYPCRSGPRNSEYYYHCRLTSRNVYDYEIKVCTRLYADSVCRSQANLCL